MTNSNNLIEVFCPGRVIKSHNNKLGFIYEVGLLRTINNHPCVRICWIPDGNTESFMYLREIKCDIVTDSAFVVYDKVLTLSEIEHFNLEYVNKTTPTNLVRIRKDTASDVEYIETLIKNCDTIIFDKNLVE